MNRLFPLLLFLLVSNSTAAQAGPLRIDYTVAPHPEIKGDGTTTVTIEVRGLRGEREVRFQMAVWSPGDYHVMDHAKYVQNVAAQYEPATRDQSQPEVTHPDANTWHASMSGHDGIRVTYTLPNTPIGFFSDNVRVRPTFAFYNGPATFMYVVGHKINPATLHITLPPGWTKCYTPLAPAEGHKGSAYSAPDFDTLADSPIVAGDIVTREFTAVGRSHTIAFFDEHAGTNYDSFPPVLSKIVVEENRVMAGPPYDRYGFFLDMGGRGGGLEHLNSCRIAWNRQYPPDSGAAFFAHEFFHLWDVKRIRPRVLGPFDYINPPHTRNLWFSEGVTDYYAEMSVYRVGLVRTESGTPAEKSLFASFAAQIAGMQDNPNRKLVSADESSLRVWEANNSSGYGGVSYYQKGKLIGLCLDLKIRAITDGRASLDVVMRDMMARYAPPKPGFPEDGIRDAVVRAGGAPMGPFYDRLCRSTEEMPFADCLAGVGLVLTGSGPQCSIDADPSASPRALQIRRGWLSGTTAGRK